MRSTRTRVPLKVRLITGAVFLLVTGWWIAEWQDNRRNEHRLAAIGSQIAGHPVRVNCPGPIRAALEFSNLGGDVQFDADGNPADETTLRKGPCAELDALAEGRRRPQLACLERSTSCGDDVQQLAWAVDTITHESFQMSGIQHEGTTECNSLQTMAWTATQLGATEEQGRALAKLMYETGYPQMPDQYRPPGCKEGGALDLRPQDPRFP